jgi:hypothetical protein
MGTTSLTQSSSNRTHRVSGPGDPVRYACHARQGGVGAVMQARQGMGGGARRHARRYGRNGRQRGGWAAAGWHGGFWRDSGGMGGNRGGCAAVRNRVGRGGQAARGSDCLSRLSQMRCRRWWFVAAAGGSQRTLRESVPASRFAGTRCFETGSIYRVPREGLIRIPNGDVR